MNSDRTAAGAENLPQITVGLGLWKDRPTHEALETAKLADEYNFPELWIGERETYDTFALATAIGSCTQRIPLTLGPLPVAVRDPAMIARGAASVAALSGGRKVRIAVGPSSPIIVTGWHGRDHRRPARAMSESVQALRHFLAQERAVVDGQVIRTRGYRLRLPAPTGYLTMAAFGTHTIRTAARQADRMAVALVTVETAAELAKQLAKESEAALRPRPPVAAWVPVAATAGAAALKQVRNMLADYLNAPGYSEMFARAGYGDVVDFARSSPRPRRSQLIEAVPFELVKKIGIFGDKEAVRQGLLAYGAAVDEVVALPCSTPDDPSGAHTLQVLQAIRQGKGDLRGPGSQSAVC
ncbi:MULTISPECIES: LLM class F420-dependent oxidoreductase [Streptomyces]|uniref:LLM class F420-dependent oxidoreductase n=1 Tax=Streptomyces TaxID=1883 RepID=UPI0009976630|nr:MULTISPECIES: LLM class F420-dependent oxidoreductase [Streptomyces]